MLGLYGKRDLPASPNLTGSEVALGSVIRKKCRCIVKVYLKGEIVMTKKFELDRRIVDVLESLDWRILSSEIYDDGNVFVELEWYSELGEDFIVSFWFNGTLSQFVSMFADQYYHFDPDQHAVDWYGANRGEPSSLQALLDDAKSIEEHLRKTSIALDSIRF